MTGRIVSIFHPNESNNAAESANSFMSSVGSGAAGSRVDRFRLTNQNLGLTFSMNCFEIWRNGLLGWWLYWLGLIGGRVSSLSSV